MLRLALFATLALAAFCAPTDKFDDIPSEYKSLIPSEVAEHLKAVTPEEKEIIKDLIKNHKNFKNEQEFLAALKEKSPSLSEKVAKLQALLEDKYKQLDEPAQILVKKIIAKGRELHGEYLAGKQPDLATLKQLAVEYIGDYNKLSAESKAKIEATFPILTAFMKNEKVQAIIKQHIQN